MAFPDRFAVLAFALLALALSGCVTQGEFPSLAPRPGEGDFSIAEPDRPAPVVPNDPAVARRVEALRRDAGAGQRAFDAAYGAAEAAVARSGASGSDSWTAGQEAISRLEAARGATPTALAALDRLSTERADMATSTEDQALISAAIAEVAEMAQAQEARIRQLRDRLGR